MGTAEIITLIIANTIAWLAIHLGCAHFGTRIPLHRFDRDCWPFRIYPFERSGFIYERIFGVKLWKERLPDGAKWLQGGFEKKRLKSRDPEYMMEFVRETRRAELIHWAVFWSAAVFYLWNPPWVIKWMFLYAALANFPCIIAQRYNRNRFERVLRRGHAISD